MAIIKTLCYRSTTSSEYESLSPRASMALSDQQQQSLPATTMTTPPSIDFIIIIAAIICVAECISLLRRWLITRRIRSRALRHYAAEKKYHSNSSSSNSSSIVPQFTYTDYSSDEDGVEVYRDNEKICTWRGETNGDDDDELNWSVF